MTSRLGLRHGRLELPGHRALVWHILDNDPWRKATCPGCGQRFIEDPRFSCLSVPIHMECEFADKHTHYDDELVGHDLPG
jgi:hypothetical protein